MSDFSFLVNSQKIFHLMKMHTQGTRTIYMLVNDGTYIADDYFIGFYDDKKVAEELIESLKPLNYHENLKIKAVEMVI